MKYINLRNGSKGLSIIAGILCIGGLLTFFKANKETDKSLALNIILTSGAMAICNEVTFRRHEDDANYQIKPIIEDKDKQILAHTKNITQLTDFTHNQGKQLTDSKTLIENQVIQINAKDTAITLLNQQLSKVKTEMLAKLAEDSNFEEEILKSFKYRLIEDMSERIFKVYNTLKNSCDAKLALEAYETIYPQLEYFSESLRENFEADKSQLIDIYQVAGDWQTVLAQTVDIYSEISDKLTSLKIKFRNLLTIDIRKNLENVSNQLDNSVPKKKALDILGEYNQFSNNKLGDLGSKIEENQNSLEEMRLQVDDLLDEIDARNLEIAELKNTIQILKQPLTWSAADARDLKIGNKIIAYFWQSGIYLDRAFAEGDIYESSIYFQTDRNSRFHKEAEFNEHSEALQQWCRVLRPITFKWDADKALMVARVILKERERVPTSIEEIRRMIEPASRFGDVVRKYHDPAQDGKPTLRVMTRTGGGKGVAVKNLLQNYVNNLDGWEIWLSDPQHGSEQDFWNIPKAAKSPTEAHKLLETFTKEFTDRKNGKSTHAKIPVLGVFDEIDKTYDKLQKQGISKIWTEIRHRDMRMILIGQSGEVGKNGWTWDEMNNCALLFIGDAIPTAIKHADDLGWSSDMKDKIPSVYKTVAEWMEGANKNLPAKNKYRVGLILNGLRFEFLEIPPAIDGSFENEKSWLVSQPWMSTNTQNTISPNNLVDSEIKAKTSIVKPEIKCTHCGSIKFIRKDKVKDPLMYAYLCKDCNQRFTSYNNKLANSN